MTNLVVKQPQQNNSFDRLKQFQSQRQELENTGEKLLKIIKDCVRKGLLANSLTKEAEKALKKLRDTRFRVAVIGEFSQGKSTLLNALLGEEIQPVRMIPCSGTVTVLKYGSKKKVTCHYKNGRSEKIPLEQYQEKAAIPEEIAEVNLTQGLENSEIKEIVFEHSELELCRNGIEIVDSPGLNEHPERSAITRQIIKDTDAIIFLTNAARLLTEGERELIQELRSELNNGATNKPAENIFVLVNFMDLVRREKDRQSIEKRANNFLIQEGIITGKNRIHFISAQAALDAILDKKEDDYLTKFRDFTQSLEQFLLHERGSLTIKQACDRFENSIRSTLEGLDNKIETYKSNKEQILEQIGEVSAINNKVQDLSSKLCFESKLDWYESYSEFLEELPIKLENKSRKWESIYDSGEKQELIQDFCEQFQEDLEEEIDKWVDKKFKKQILIPKLEILDLFISEEMAAIEQNLQLSNTDFELNDSNSLAIAGINNDDDDNNGLGVGVISGIGGSAVAGLLGFSLFPALIAGGIIGLAFGLFNSQSEEEKINEIKAEVIGTGLDKFGESIELIEEQFEQNIYNALNVKVEAVEKAIQEIISRCEETLEQEDSKYQKALKQQEIAENDLADRTKEIKQIQQEIETIYSRSIG